MAIAHQQTVVGNITNNIGIDLAITTSSGTDRTLVAYAFYIDVGSTTTQGSTMVFNTSESFTVRKRSLYVLGSDCLGVEIWTLDNPSASTTANVGLTMSQTTIYLNLVVSEYTGANNGIGDNTSAATGNSTNPAGSFTTASTSNKALWCAGEYNVAGGFTAAGGETERADGANDSGVLYHAVYEEAAAAGASSITMTIGSATYWSLAGIELVATIVSATVTLDAAAATATGIPLADVLSLVRLTLDPAAATAQAINLTVSAPPSGLAVQLDGVTLTATCPVITVRGGHTIALDAAAAVATGVALKSVAVSQTITLDTAVATASVNDITLDLPDYSVQDVGLFFPPFIDLSTATLTGTGIGIHIGTTVELDTATATATGIGINKVGQTVNLDTAALTATPISTITSQQQFITLKTPVLTATAISITPSVVILLSEATLTTTVETLAVSAPVTRILNTAQLTAEPVNIQFVVQTLVELDPAAATATAIPLKVIPQQFISLDTAQLTATSLNIDATASVLLDTTSLTATSIALDVVPGAIAIVLDPSVATLTPIPLSLTTGIIVFLETG